MLAHGAGPVPHTGAGVAPEGGHDPESLRRTLTNPKAASRPRILVTNDDGISSAGLHALALALMTVGDVLVVAPQRNWSASGHNKTLRRPLRVRKVRVRGMLDGYVCSGSPTDCVALGALNVAEVKPDLLVSGINYGANLAEDLTYSGTVAAAMEGVIAGLPSIAISLDGYHPSETAIPRNGPMEPFQFAAGFAARLASQLWKRRLGPGTFLNVNVPHLPAEQITGVAITRLGKRIYHDELVRGVDPHGREYYVISGIRPSGETREGTDLGALASGKISVTPVHLDLTNTETIAQLYSWDLESILDHGTAMD